MPSKVSDPARPPLSGEPGIINLTLSNAVPVSVKRSEYHVSKTASSMTTRLFGL